MDGIIAAIYDNELDKVQELLGKNNGLAISVFKEDTPFEGKIIHWLYSGDTVLHLAAAGHRKDIIESLISNGADPNSSNSRRRSTPLHYACDGVVHDPVWNAQLQVGSVKALIESGAELDAQDSNGATPLHRAVRARCAGVVEFLLEKGANPEVRNKSGSTAFHLAVQNTGRGGTGLDSVKNLQRNIILSFIEANVSPDLKDAKGRSVSDSAKSDWVKELLR